MLKMRYQGSWMRFCYIGIALGLLIVTGCGDSGQSGVPPKEPVPLEKPDKDVKPVSGAGGDQKAKPLK